MTVEVLFDASGSMLRTHPTTGRRKIDEAKEALRRFVERAPEGLKLGLRVFGTSTPNTDPYKAEGCLDTKQLIPVDGGSPREVLRAVRGIEARGWTPLGYSMRQVIEDFRGVSGPKRLVVITDGRERCESFDGNPAGAVRALTEAGIEVKVAFIGHDTPPAVRQSLIELAAVGSVDVLTLSSPRELREVLARAAEALVTNATATHQPSQTTYPVSTASPTRVPVGTYSLEIPPISGVTTTPTRLSDFPVRAGKTTRLDILFVEGEAQVEITTR
ncbi:MAG: VWA domain-containing protein [Acidobacteriota bacterium]